MQADVKFIFGRSGSGKTHAVFSAIAENEANSRRSLLIVPDRATFETEKALAAFLGGGMLETSVLSFTRLASRINADAGERRAFLSAQGRRMLERRIIDESANELDVFRRVSRHRGFASECDAIILNCKRFMITPEMLLEAQGLPEQLAAKLRDFALIYKKLNERMENRYIDGEDQINSIIEHLPESFVKGAHVFIDAPDMLNVQSIRIIEAMLSAASSVTVTFRAPDEGDADAYLFAPDLDRYRRLEDICKNHGLIAEKVFLSGNKRTKGALAALEANLFAYPYMVFNGDASEIELHSSLDRQNEVRECAESILEAVRGGLRFRDIAVAASDIAGYSGFIRRCFPSFGIPFFTDASRSVSSHPISQLILSALRCVQADFRSDDFINLLKTGLTGLSDAECEKLENHIIKFGLQGKRLHGEEPSVKKHDEIEGFDELERLRLAVAAPILELKKSLSEAGDRSALSRAKALYAYLERLDIAAKLKAESEELASREGMLLYAMENRQIYDTVIALLDQISLIIGDEAIGLERFISVVDEGLSSYTVGVIPTTLDQVLVGDVSSIHLPDIKYLIVLGANDGLLPASRSDNSIIDDRDLAAMRAAGIEAWDTSSTMSRAEKLSLYSLLTKPTQRLSLFYSKRIEGAPAEIAPAAARCGSVFPHAKRRVKLTPLFGFSDKEPGADEAAFSDLARLTRRFIDTGKEGEGLAELYSHFAASSDYKAPLAVLDRAYFDENSPAPLGQDAAMRLYGRHITGTPTRLEVFNRCPFCYVMQFGLRLEERQVREERAVDHGSLIHDALDKLLKKLIETKAELSSVTNQQLDSLLGEFLPALLEEHNFGILLESAYMRAELAKLREEIEGIAIVMLRQLTSGRFMPYASELSFGRKDDGYPALELISDSGAHFSICGIIDRVDMLTLPDGTDRFRIIDYKTGSVGFDYSELQSGLRLQLPLYAAAMRAAFSAARKADPAGLYYMHVADQNSFTGDDETDEKELMKQMKLSGPTVSEEGIITASDGTDFRYSLVIEGLHFKKKEGVFAGKTLISAEEMDHTLSKAEELGRLTLDAIMEGRAEVSPSILNKHTGCTYCPYVSICRFDTTAGSRYRRIRSVNEDTFFGRKGNKK